MKLKVFSPWLSRNRRNVRLFVCSHQLVHLWAASVNESIHLICLLFLNLIFSQPSSCCFSSADGWLCFLFHLIHLLWSRHVAPRGRGKAHGLASCILRNICLAFIPVASAAMRSRKVLVAGLMFLIAYRVPKRLMDSLIFKHVWNVKQARLYVYPSKPYVFLSLWSAESNSCSTLICLPHRKRAVDIRMCSVRDGLEGGLQPKKVGCPLSPFPLPVVKMRGVSSAMSQTCSAQFRKSGEHGNVPLRKTVR